MRGIAKLLFGGDGDRDGLSGLLAGDDGWWRAADQVRRAGEWCDSTPGRDSAAAAARGSSRGRPGTRQVSPRGPRPR
jgi:hypothetical protein